MFEKVPIVGVANFAYTWMLNPITSIDRKAKLDFGQFPSKQAAEEWYYAMRVEKYYDEQPHPVTGKMEGHTKHFKKGSQLEWMNPADGMADEHEGFGLHRVLVSVENIQEVLKEHPAPEVPVGDETSIEVTE